MRDEEIPRIALLTAAFFVVSVVRVQLGPTSVHLLMNGLVGIVLSIRAPLAIFSGLFLQFWLVNHGGQQTLGINTVILSVPALVVWFFFCGFQKLPCLRHGWFRVVLVMTAVALWIVSLVFAVALLANGSVARLEWASLEAAWRWTCNPATVIVAIAIAALAAWGEARLENVPKFLGLLLGELAVLMSVGLNCVVLIAAGEEFWGPTTPLALLVLHLPIAVFEGIVVGFTVGFLAKVKPEMFRDNRQHVSSWGPRRGRSH